MLLVMMIVNPSSVEKRLKVDPLWEAPAQIRSPDREHGFHSFVTAHFAAGVHQWSPPHTVRRFKAQLPPLLAPQLSRPQNSANLLPAPSRVGLGVLLDCFAVDVITVLVLFDVGESLPVRVPCFLQESLAFLEEAVNLKLRALLDRLHRQREELPHGPCLMEKGCVVKGGYFFGIRSQRSHPRSVGNVAENFVVPSSATFCESPRSSFEGRNVSLRCGSQEGLVVTREFELYAHRRPLLDGPPLPRFSLVERGGVIVLQLVLHPCKVAVLLGLDGFWWWLVVIHVIILLLFLLHLFLLLFLLSRLVVLVFLLVLLATPFPLRSLHHGLF
mmetsp:Transcript_23196/g.48142  ORF Transcript_23196/g.48142 Transcript_23196/m.48142 type:complete len:329 (+) Transcript_23196:676-1662(+)